MRRELQPGQLFYGAWYKKAQKSAYANVLESPGVCVHVSDSSRGQRDNVVDWKTNRKIINDLQCRGQKTRKNTTALRECILDRSDWHTIGFEPTCTFSLKQVATVVSISN